MRMPRMPTNMGTNMAAVKQQKHLSLCSAIETESYYSSSETLKYFTCSRAKTFSLRKTLAITHPLAYWRAISMSRNAQNLEIQTCSTTK